jgi:hypothetical protein
MDIQVADERAFVLRETLDWDQAKEKAWDKKTAMFGTISRLFLKGEDIEIVYSERRYEPFWHLVCKAHYVYDRNQSWTFRVSGPEVKQITIRDEDFEVRSSDQQIAISGIEHCREDYVRDVILDGVTGKPVDKASYLEFQAEPIDVEKFAPENSIIVPPQVRASSVVRQVLGEMLKPVQADVVIEELVAIEAIDLYYAPVYAFEYHWESKAKRTVAEFDGLTGELRREGKALRQQLGQVFTKDVLFDVGADFVGMLIPGGSIAIKVAKAVADSRKSG